LFCSIYRQAEARTLKPAGSPVFGEAIPSSLLPDASGLRLGADGGVGEARDPARVWAPAGEKTSVPSGTFCPLSLIYCAKVCTLVLRRCRNWFLLCEFFWLYNCSAFIRNPHLDVCLGFVHPRCAS
jgi:hypothetical protein